MASVAADMKFTFLNVQFTLLVGVSVGLLIANHDIHLGDIVVRIPYDSHDRGLIFFRPTRDESS